MEIEEFIEFVKIREATIDFDDARTIIAFKDTYRTVDMYTKKLRQYFSSEDFSFLVCNLWLHEYIVSGYDEALYRHYDIDSKAMIVSSASNSGSSTSIQGFKSLEDGRFMLMDLWRTPYGRAAYILLESLQGLAIVRL